MAATSSFHRILSQLNLRHGIPNDRRLFAYVGLGITVGVPLLTYWVSTYRSWLALGRGGLPPNPFGWLVQALLHPVSRSDVRAPAPWTLEDTEARWGAVGRKSFFLTEGGSSSGSPPPPPRTGPRPTVPTYVAPQRQTTEQVSPAMLERMDAYVASLASANPGVFQLKPSGLEGPFRDAVWLSGGLAVPAYLKGTKGEFVHVHDEGSTHAVLSLVDATRAIETGWAERHKLSGVAKDLIPWGYVLIYAPRDDGEFESWKAFVLAATRFNAEAAGVTGVTVPPA